MAYDTEVTGLVAGLGGVVAPRALVLGAGATTRLQAISAAGAAR
ncbi:hypothetical protein ACIHCV_28600 [Streptomyces sp. NPDC051956]